MKQDGRRELHTFFTSDNQKKKTNENQQSQKTSFRLGTNTKEMFKIDPGWKTSSPRD